MMVLALWARPAEATGQRVLTQWLYSTALEFEYSAAPGETRPQYLARLETISESAATAALEYADGTGWTASELGLAIMILWNEETRFDERVHAGTGHPVWHEDHGQAKCLGQIHASLVIPEEEWEMLTGTDAGRTLLCARATAKVFVSKARNCGVWSGQRATEDKVSRVYASYGSGGACVKTDSSDKRAAKWQARIAKRPDQAPVKGYRRILPSEVPDEVRAAARELIGASPKLGARVELGNYLLFVEHHANAKTGVSVLLRKD